MQPQFPASPPPHPSSHANVPLPYTPHPSSVADDSDADFDPTPIHSAGGPQYDDLPPSYDEAQHQAVADARDGVAPIDPNQLGAHRLTLNEGPNEPEIWEYFVRGEQVDPANEQELAPEYETHVNNPGSVPVHYVESSSNIPVGRVGSSSSPSASLTDLHTALLDKAMTFSRHELDSDVQYAPRLTRPIAIPQKPSKGRGREASVDQQPPGYVGGDDSDESVQFLRAYAKALHGHSIRPAEFTEFLDGVNVLCAATNATANDLLKHTTPMETSSDFVHNYIRAANEAFFAPRGLRVSIQSLSTLLHALDIPTDRGQQAGAVAGVLDRANSAAKRAQALYPWIEALEINVPELSTHTLMLRQMGNRLRGQIHSQDGARRDTANYNSPGKARGQTSAEGPPAAPYPVQQSTEGRNRASNLRGPGPHGFRGRGGRRGGPWTPFGVPGNGPFGARGNGPFGRSNRAAVTHRGYGRTGSRSNHPGSSQHANNWAAWGENIGKLGEEFGKTMGDWGQQFGKRAETWGQDVGKRAEVWGEAVSARASGSGTQGGNRASPVHDDPPLSYLEGPLGQDTGILLHGDSKASTSISSPMQNKGKKFNDMDDADDDTSSISSDSSDSDSDSDSDDEDYPDTEAVFLKRIHSINEQADVTAKKGKKTATEVANERALAIEKAQKEKTAMDLKIEEKQTKRAIKLSLRQKGRELKKAHRQRKREMKKTYVGKGKGKAKKTREWKEAKREYRERKKELRREKMAARKEWREARYDRKALKKEEAVGADDLNDAMGHMVWMLVENLGA